MPSPHAHLYDSRWQKASKEHLSRNRLCVPCMRAGRKVRATLVHHKRPHRGNRVLFWDRGNWESRCTTCHADAESAEKGRTPERYRGCDEDGVPLDPRHRWRGA